jgi:hypothetical protein
MIRLTLAMILGAAAIINLGTVAASTNGRVTRADPLLENWEKEEELANLLSDMIASSKTSSPTATGVPSIVRNFLRHLFPQQLDFC